MLEGLAVWGIFNAGGYLAKEVIGPLAKDALEDYTKDFFKESIKEYTGLSDQDTQKKLLVKALKAFVALVEKELKIADLSKQEVKQYTKPLKQYINNQSIKAILGSAFNYGCQEIDTETLAKTWVELKLLPLPEEFRWKYIGRQYLKQVQTIIKQSDKLRPIRNFENIEAIAKNTEATAGIIPDFDLREYQEAILERYGNVKLDSLDTDGSAYNQLKLWNIFIPQNVREVHDLMPEAIHELPKDYDQKLRESGQLEQEIDQKELEKAKKLYYQQPIKSVLDVIKDSQSYRYLVVLGDPGSGKSTLLQYLALEWARTDITTAFSLPIPLLIELRTYIRNRDSGQCNNFLEFCHQSSGAICHLNQHQIHDQLKAGNALVMFDGLDEVFDLGKREDVITDIHRFTNKYPKVRVIVTSRVIGYKPQRLRDAEFRHVMLQDLESEQIQTFIEHWHELTFTDQADKVRKRERLQKAIDTSSPIRQLAQNPLLLTMMAILNRNQELPRDRSELYNQSSRLLLHQWDYDYDPYGNEAKLVRDIRIKAVVAVATHWQDHPDTLPLLQELAGSDTDLDLRVTAIKQLAQGYKDHPDAFATLQELARSDTDSWVRRTAIEQLAQCYKDHPDAFATLQQSARSDTDLDLRVTAIKQLAQGYKDHPDAFATLQQLACSDIYVLVRRTAIEQLAQGYQDHPDTLALLQQSARSNTDSRVRATAIEQLAQGYQDHPDTLALLQQSARSDPDSRVRRTAIEQLAQCYQDHRDTLPLLQQSARSDTNWELRITAIEQLAQGYQDHRDTLPLLQASVRSDTDSWVRITAIEQLAQGYQDHRDTFALLQQSARFDTDSDVRVTAIEQLAQGWHDRVAWPTANQPWLFEFLCDRILHDPFERKERWDDNPRQAALKAILEYYPNHSQTRSLLQDRADHDSDPKLRKFAQKELVKLSSFS
ncbi:MULTISPECIES: HEAT repeat domain-containing protein [unclassified Moorena]|uniref:NACHT domain-containing protein n=1 Tax=unclassified Moorena TaxID=2683338 RepID=UPI00140136C8|nr:MULTISPECIES: HEAT repeat domain-containing protein [unclassified Moorena]NEO16397.1 NACHT domain-containing protein [Moorena sp. SIO3E8]NEQ04225.1 NACHT domain-containing protein [Moorena sp. SIO3F7]